MYKLLKFALIGAAALSIAGSAFAQQLHLETNKTKPIKLRGDANAVVIGNPLVADVIVHDQNLIFITGRSSGTTNLVIFNAKGQQIYASDVVVSTDSANHISINRAGAVNTYDCAPRCAPVAAIGDDATYFGQVIQQTDAIIDQTSNAD